MELAKDQVKWATKVLSKYHSFSVQNYRSVKLEDDFKNALSDVSANSGVYLVLAKSRAKDFQVVYIGSSGKLKKVDGKGVITVRNGGVRSRLVNGKVKEERDDALPRHKVNRAVEWKKKMKKSGFIELRIFWLDTVFKEEEAKHTKIPLYVESSIMQSYFEDFGLPPEWNVSF